MATAYYSKVANTVVSGSSLMSSLGAGDLRALQYASAVSGPAPMVMAGTGVASGVALSLPNLVQAVVGAQVVNNAATGAINVGTDSASQAGAYIQLLNLNSTNDVAVLRFIATSNVGSVQLFNSSGTDTFVNIQLNGGSDAAQQLLFDPAQTQSSTGANAAAGIQRVVLVSASNLTAGSQVVNFNVCSASR